MRPSGLRPWPKGVSGNPGGRPKGLVSYIRERTGDGQEIADMMLTVLKGQPVAGRKPTLRDMMEAGTWLADRGWGKATQPVGLTGSAGLFDEMSDDELEAYVQQQIRLAGGNGTATT